MLTPETSEYGPMLERYGLYGGLQDFESARSGEVLGAVASLGHSWDALSTIPPQWIEPVKDSQLTHGFTHWFWPLYLHLSPGQDQSNFSFGVDRLRPDEVPNRDLIRVHVGRNALWVDHSWPYDDLTRRTCVYDAVDLLKAGERVRSALSRGAQYTATQVNHFYRQGRIRKLPSGPSA